MIPPRDNDPLGQWSKDADGQPILNGLTKAETDELVYLAGKPADEITGREISRKRLLFDKHMLAHNRLYFAVKQSQDATKH